MKRLKFLLTGIPYYEVPRNAMKHIPTVSHRIAILLQRDVHWLYKILCNDLGGWKW